MTLTTAASVPRPYSHVVDPDDLICPVCHGPAVRCAPPAHGVVAVIRPALAFTHRDGSPLCWQQSAGTWAAPRLREAFLEALRRRICPTCRREVDARSHLSWSVLGECGDCAEQREACSAGRHRFGPWGACGCAGAIADHFAWFVPGWCGWWFRTCGFCPASEEHYADDLPTQPLAGGGAR